MAPKAQNLRKLAELTEKLNLRDQHLRCFVRHLPVPVAMMDKDKRYLLCSESWAKRYQLNVEEVQGHEAKSIEDCQTIPWYYEDGTLGGEIAFSNVENNKGAIDE